MGCDSSKPSDSPQIPVRSALPTLAVPTGSSPTANPTTAPVAPTAAPPSGTGPAATAGPTVAPTSAATPAPSETASPTPSAVASAVAAIEGADLSNDDSLDALDRIRLTPEGRDAARAILERGPGNASQAWAAIVVYAATGNDPAPLRPFAADANPSVAVLAAATLVAFGDAAGFATLEKALSSEQVLAGSHPPRMIGDFALSTLERYVQGANVPTVGPESTVEDYLADWTAWLDGHAAGLAFNSSTGTWAAP
jgi:hypothetical protein